MLAASRREGSPRPGGGSHPSGRWGRGGPSASLQAAACLVCGEALPTPGEAPVAGAYSSLAAERILLAEARQAPRTCASLLIVSFPRRRRPCASEEFFSLNQILGLMIEAAPSEAPRDMAGEKRKQLLPPSRRQRGSGMGGWGSKDLWTGPTRECGRALSAGCVCRLYAKWLVSAEGRSRGRRRRVPPGNPEGVVGAPGRRRGFHKTLPPGGGLGAGAGRQGGPCSQSHGHGRSHGQPQLRGPAHWSARRRARCVFLFPDSTPASLTQTYLPSCILMS